MPQFTVKSWRTFTVTPITRASITGASCKHLAAKVSQFWRNALVKRRSLKPFLFRQIQSELWEVDHSVRTCVTLFYLLEFSYGCDRSLDDSLRQRDYFRRQNSFSHSSLDSWNATTRTQQWTTLVAMGFTRHGSTKTSIGPSIGAQPTGRWAGKETSIARHSRANPRHQWSLWWCLLGLFDCLLLPQAYALATSSNQLSSDCWRFHLQCSSRSELFSASSALLSVSSFARRCHFYARVRTFWHFLCFFYSFRYRNMKQNLVVLLADIYNLFEIHPAPCVDCPESEVASGEFTSWLELSISAIVDSLCFFCFFVARRKNLSFMNMFVVCEKILCAKRENIKQWLGVFFARKR